MSRTDPERRARAAPSPAVHPTAIVEDGARLGAGVDVGPYCVVHAGAEIGDGCRLGPYVHVHARVELGEGCVVGSGSSLGGPPQDVKYAGEPTRVRIGAGCQLHEGVSVHRATGQGAETVVGAGVMLMAGAHVGHNCRVGDGVVMVNGSMLGGHAEVGERALLSGNSAVHQFCRVGRLTLVGGACMATRDAPPFSIVVGSYPPRWRAPNTVGLRRAGLGVETRTAIRRALVAIFRATNARAAAEALAQDPVAEVAELARFVLDSKRGVCHGPPAAEAREDSAPEPSLPR